MGVGPGDPELMTLKAARLVRETKVIAVPGSRPEESAAYRIAVQAVPELKEKELLGLSVPMATDKDMIGEAHREGAAALKEVLDRGEDVVYLTLGDPTIYCSFSYFLKLLKEEGYPVEVVSGVPSFCAAAARLQIPLAEWDEQLHVIPGVYYKEEPEFLKLPGTCVLMKASKMTGELKEMMKRSGRDVSAVIRCGMEGEKVCRGAEELPERPGYFTLVIAKEAADGEQIS